MFEVTCFRHPIRNPQIVCIRLVNGLSIVLHLNTHVFHVTFPIPGINVALNMNSLSKCQPSPRRNPARRPPSYKYNFCIDQNIPEDENRDMVITDVDCLRQTMVY